jgi:PelA/Pel-15E family pectate lyase
MPADKIHEETMTRSFSALLLALACSAAPVHSAGPTRAEALAALRKAADFLANRASVHGGYVYLYSTDLSQRWGEIPARQSQIWVQPPGTTAVAETFLDAWRVTGEHVFLDYTKQAADALVWGQHPAGGWHYLIDFDMTGIRQYYDEIASRCWGWEEYLHYYGNCTFDDEATTAPTRLLLDLYTETLDPRYRMPLLKALDFILSAQYPNGSWPQRFPLSHEYPHDGHPDYTSYYTFNDGVIRGNIDLLLEAWEKLGNEEYRKAAYRGMDFYLISRQPVPQAGWADQYTPDMKPGHGRSYEPPAICTGLTLRNIRDLMDFYRITGDRRYLQPIPDAIAWLDSSVINTDPAKNYSHAYYYEPGTNLPIWNHRSGTSIRDGQYWNDHDMTNLYPYAVPLKLDTSPYKRDFERVNVLTPGTARSEYEKKKGTGKRYSAPTPQAAARVIETLDERGAWITDIEIPAYFGDVFKNPRKKMKGISIPVSVRNMNTLIAFIAASPK